MPAKYSGEQGQELIALARKAIESEFSGIEVEIPDKVEFKQARGVFVTLTKNRELRGCIGFLEPRFAIGKAIVNAAKSSAFSDPRFIPLKQDELMDVKIEISVLTQPSEIKRNVAENIKIGEDGLICEYMGYSGLLLPQVATEHNMDKIEFLECVCEKAGLPKDSWQNKKVKFSKFQAQVFREK